MAQARSKKKKKRVPFALEKWKRSPYFWVGTGLLAVALGTGIALMTHSEKKASAPAPSKVQMRQSATGTQYSRDLETEGKKYKLKGGIRVNLK